MRGIGAGIGVSMGLLRPDWANMFEAIKNTKEKIPTHTKNV